jgi:N-acetylmuramoyl-L-alanine amidase
LTQVSVPGVHLSPTACVSFEPTHGSARGVVFLDAGHGGIDTGALGRTAGGAPVVEKKITLQVVKIITAQLRDAGYRVVVSRWTDTEVRVPGAGDTNGKLFTPLGVRRDVLARISCANAARAHVLLSVHMNSFSDPREGGAMTVYDPDRTFSSTSRRLATIVHGKIMAAYRTAGISIEDRFVLRDTATGGSALTAEGARYGHLILIGPKYKTFVPTPSAMPGVIVEPLFLTHPTEASIAASSRGQMLLANAITAALLQYLR